MKFKTIICWFKGHDWEAYTQLISHTLFNRYGQPDTRTQPFQKCRLCGKRESTGPIWPPFPIEPDYNDGRFEAEYRGGKS